MTDATHHARPTRKLVGVVLAAVAALVVPAVALAAPPEGKGPEPSSPVANATFAFSSGSLPTTPGAEGLAYVVKGDPFSVEAKFFDGGEQPVAFSENTSTMVWLVYNGAPIGPAVEVAAGVKLANFPGLEIPDPASDVTITLVADTKPRASSYDSDPFDVLIEDVDVATNQLTSIGGGAPAGVACDPTAANPICADLVPPAGGFGAGGLISRGLCAAGDKCRVEYVQALAPFADADDDGLAPTPATLIMKCDKIECGGGAINKKQLNVTLSPNPASPFAGTFTAPACPAKGTVDFMPQYKGGALLPITADNLPFCVDYVQSTRSNAGDTYLYLLFVVDAKVRFL